MYRITKIRTTIANRPCNGLHGEDAGNGIPLSNCPNNLDIWEFFNVIPPEDKGDCTPSPEDGMILVIAEIDWVSQDALPHHQREGGFEEVLFSAKEQEDWSKYLGMDSHDARTIRALDMFEREGLPVYLGAQMNSTSGVQGVFSSGIAHIGWDKLGLDVGEPYVPQNSWDAQQFFDTMVNVVNSEGYYSSWYENGRHTQRLMNLLVRKAGYTYDGEDYSPPAN